jgi:hypothetical protein
MKKVLLLALMATLAGIARSQLVLNRAYTPQNGSDYFELGNPNNNPVSLGCYSLLAFFDNGQEKGFYVIRFPEQQVGGQEVVSLSASTGVSTSIGRRHLSFGELFQNGLLERYVLNTVGSRFDPISQQSLSRYFNRIAGGGEWDEHIVLLFNGATLVDASVAVDAQSQPSRFFMQLPDLRFNNGCGSAVNVRFSSLPSAYASLFSQQGQLLDRGYFREMDIRLNNATVQIAWQTIREQNNRGFDVERRVGDGNWTTVAYVASLAPGGNSNQTLTYLYGDPSPASGRVQYRLRQVDLNGRATYSPLRTLNQHGLPEKMVVYPNPSTDGQVNIAFGKVNALRDVQVVDVNGQILQQLVSVNTSTQQITNLRRGQYFIRVIDRAQGTITTEKLIVQ